MLAGLGHWKVMVSERRGVVRRSGREHEHLYKGSAVRGAEADRTYRRITTVLGNRTHTLRKVGLMLTLILTRNTRFKHKITFRMV